MAHAIPARAMKHGMDASAIALERVSKKYGGHGAVNDVSLEIREGVFFSLLGPRPPAGVVGGRPTLQLDS